MGLQIDRASGERQKCCEHLQCQISCFFFHVTLSSAWFWCSPCWLGDVICSYSSSFYLLLTQLPAPFILGTALAGDGFCVLFQFPLEACRFFFHNIYCHCVVWHFLLLMLCLALCLHLSFIPAVGFEETVRQLFPSHPLCDNTLDFADFFHDPFQLSLFQTKSWTIQ